MVAARARDLSPGGLFAIVDQAPPPGEQLRVELHPHGSDRPLFLRAQVVWRRQWAETSARPAGCGLRFLDLSSPEIRILEGLDRPPEPAPTDLPPDPVALPLRIRQSQAAAEPRTLESPRRRPAWLLPDTGAEPPVPAPGEESTPAPVDAAPADERPTPPTPPTPRPAPPVRDPERPAVPSRGSLRRRPVQRPGARILVASSLVVAVVAAAGIWLLQDHPTGPVTTPTPPTETVSPVEGSAPRESTPPREAEPDPLTAPELAEAEPRTGPPAELGPRALEPSTREVTRPESAETPSGPIRVVDVEWRPAGAAVELVITTDRELAGPLPAARLEAPPRVLVRLAPAAGRYDPARTEGDGRLVVAVRSGLHRSPAGDELHLVVDLADVDVELIDSRVSGREALLAFGRPETF